MAIAGLSLVLVAFAVLRRLPTAGLPELAVALAEGLLGAALLVVTVAVRRKIEAGGWVSWLALAGGAAGALTWLAAAAALPMWAAERADVFAELAPVGTGVWALAVCGAAWKLRLWPPPLRIAGTVFGAAAMIQPGFPPAALISLLAGLPWWIGLGVQLLRAPRSTGG